LLYCGLKDLFIVIGIAQRDIRIILKASLCNVHGAKLEIIIQRFIVEKILLDLEAMLLPKCRVTGLQLPPVYCSIPGVSS
jgi:hypothetical protein